MNSGEQASMSSDKPVGKGGDVQPATFRYVRRWGAAVGICGIVIAVLIFFAYSTRETRRAVRTYALLTSAVNAQDLEKLRSLCTRRYLGVHPLKSAEEGGVIGFPRSIHKNFQAWREEGAVWLCPTNRVGPVYQFLEEDGEWKYDGVVGLLRSGGQILLLSDEARASEDSNSLVVP
jgi:hypothetical protein